MRYSAVPWTLEQTRHVDVVQELLDAGLEPGGCLVNDLSPQRNSRMLRGYDDETRATLVAGMGRPFPILWSRDRCVAVEVSDLYGVPALRMRTFLEDGALVETECRWHKVPPWPGRLSPFRRFTTVEREMARAVAPGRTLLISDQPPVGQLEDHRREVATVSAARATAPVPYADMEGVAIGWNDAYAHEHTVARRTDFSSSACLIALMLLLLTLDPTGLLDGPWWPVPTLVLGALVWWALPGVVVLLRRRITWRPAFRTHLGGVP